MGIQVSHVSLGLAGLDVYDADVGPDGFDTVGDIGVLPGEDVYLHPHIAQGRRQLPDIHVHST